MFFCIGISLMPFQQMLGLTINTFIDAFNKEDYNFHRSKASTMDINNVMEPRIDFPPTVEEPMLGLKTDDEPFPSQ